MSTLRGSPGRADGRADRPSTRISDVVADFEAAVNYGHGCPTRSLFQRLSDFPERPELPYTLPPFLSGFAE